MDYKTTFLHLTGAFPLTHWQQLQDAAEDLQSRVEDVLVASKPLFGQLEPPAANFIQSETRFLSRDILLLGQTTSGKMKSLQVRQLVKMLP